MAPSFPEAAANPLKDARIFRGKDSCHFWSNFEEIKLICQNFAVLVFGHFEWFYGPTFCTLAASSMYVCMYVCMYVYKRPDSDLIYSFYTLLRLAKIHGNRSDGVLVQRPLRLPFDPLKMQYFFMVTFYYFFMNGLLLQYFFTAEAQYFFMGA
jgi:hypothetical protein